MIHMSPQVLKEIRSTYDGPLSLATDYMVWNVTKDKVRVRMSAIDEDIWPLPSLTEKLPANPGDRVGFSDFITNGRVTYSEVVEWYYEETNKMFGTDYKAPK